MTEFMNVNLSMNLPGDTDETWMMRALNKRISMYIDKCLVFTETT